MSDGTEWHSINAVIPARPRAFSVGSSTETLVKKAWTKIRYTGTPYYNLVHGAETGYDAFAYKYVVPSMSGNDACYRFFASAKLVATTTTEWIQLKIVYDTSTDLAIGQRVHNTPSGTDVLIATVEADRAILNLSAAHDIEVYAWLENSSNLAIADTPSTFFCGEQIHEGNL